MSARAKQILVFLLLVYVFSCLPYYLIIRSGHLMVGNGMVISLLMWCPALAAFATCLSLGIHARSLGWKWASGAVAWSYVIPIFYALPVYIVAWVAIRGSFAFSRFAQPLGEAFGFSNSPRLVTLFLAIPLYSVVGVIASSGRALGEEIGWRGFLLPRLVGQFGFTWGCLISGAIWASWHYPGLLFADYNAGTNRAFALTCFTVMVIAISFVAAWFRLKSGSLWPAAIMHASHNLFIQAVFDGMTAPEGRVLYITTEFGAGLALTVSAFALYFWARRGEVAQAAA
jgi:membrane protease YdiL (CAAX protease family)